MKADKNLELFKTLSQRVRIDILKKLYFNSNPLPFSKLQKEVLGLKPNSVNFSFHIKALKKNNLIDSSDKGYTLNSLGKQILKNILSIEQIINEQNKTIMIRTSKYSKEPFDFKKIEEYLIKEGEMDSYSAKRIAQEVEERLSKTKIEYFTAPLMREYINAVLLENGFEYVRHKLTRLGTPPFEVLKLFESNKMNPENFIKRLGSDVSEQFLLLNLLPKHLADMYLSGEVALLNLNYWSLRPLSLCISTNVILDYIFKKYFNSLQKIEKIRDFGCLILKFSEILTKIKPYFSEDLLLSNFNNSFLSKFSFIESEETSHFFEIIASEVLKYNTKFEDKAPRLSLEFSSKNGTNVGYDYSSQFNIDKSFLETIKKYQVSNNNSVQPLILFDYSQLNKFNLESSFINEILSSSQKNNVIFYNQSFSNLLNSTIINVKSFNDQELKDPKIILDKVLLNLHLIALEANQNDDIFLDLIQERTSRLFELFTHKEILTRKKLNSLKGWNSLLFLMFGDDNNRDWVKNSIKSISFFGLNEAIKVHCGIEIDRIESSELFALKVLSLMKKIIEEENERSKGNFVLTQPHRGKYLKNLNYDRSNELDNATKIFLTSIVRDDSNLSLNKKIELFKKFERILDGGSVFNFYLKSNDLSLERSFNILSESNLKAFSINNHSL